MYILTKALSITAIIKLMRPKHWIKNTFVLAPLLFSGLFTKSYAVKQAIIGFILFSIACSATYILNDYLDINKDKKHPVKSKTRPLATGEVTVVQAMILLAFLYSLLATATIFFYDIMLVIVIYLVLNIAYSLYLKTQPVLDIFVIATGFVLRVYAGSIMIKVPLSSWMCITTLSLALYLASIKRIQELKLNGDNARKVLEMYPLALVDKYALISAILTLIFYSFYVVTDNPNMVISIPVVLFGLYRYWFIVEAKQGGESPTNVVFTDLHLQIAILCWLIISIYSFYR